MGILPDWMIERDVKIEPFAPQQSRPGVISYGVTSYGYDARVGYKFQVFSPINAREIDPKNFDPNCMVAVDLTPRQHQFGPPVLPMTAHGPSAYYYRECEHCRLQVQASHPDFWPQPVQPCGDTPNHNLIPPHGFILAETIETFTIPRDCLAVVLGKSTYARCGLIVNVTPLEPEWTGRVTIEISNTTPLPARVYCGEGIMQVLFLRTDGKAAAKFEAIENFMETEARGKVGGIGGGITGPGDWYRGYQILKAAEGVGTCRTSYADKKGKYQGATGIDVPKVVGAANSVQPSQPDPQDGRSCSPSQTPPPASPPTKS